MKHDILEILHWGKLRNREKKERPIVFPRKPIYSSEPINIYSKKSSTNPTITEKIHKRNVFVSVSYKKYDHTRLTDAGKKNIQRNAIDTVEYFFRFEGKFGFDENSNSISKEEALERFKNDAVFRIIISPENPEVLTPYYIRAIIEHIENETGHKLKWTGVFHDNTDHPHAHIIISRTDGYGISWEQPLKISKAMISSGIREYAEDIATRILGHKTKTDYRKPFLQTIQKTGLARIDHIIHGNPTKGTNLFIQATSTYSVLSLERLKKLPSWQQQLVFERLNFLQKNTKAGFKYISGEWRCYNPETWKNILIDEEKLQPFKDIPELKNINIHIDHANKTLERPFTGIVLHHVLVDDNSQKVGLIIKDTEGIIHYTETEMEYSMLKTIDGKSVSVEPRKARNDRFRTPVVKLQTTRK